MALIREGSFEDLPASPVLPSSDGGEDARASLSGLSTIGELEQATRSAQPVKADFPVSAGNRGLALKDFMLEKGFEGFLGNMFGADNEIYMVSWAWDLSGAEPIVEPAPDKAQDFVHSLQPGERIEYLGDGRLIFPARPVTGGFAVRIQVCESDQEVRAAGDTLETIRKAIEDSKLTSVLSLVALAGGPTTATLGLVKDTANELSKVISAILKANSNDFVDLYEGYFSATGDWTPGSENVRGTASHLTFYRLE